MLQRVRTEKIFALVFIPIHRCGNIVFIFLCRQRKAREGDGNACTRENQQALKEEKRQWLKRAE